MIHAIKTTRFETLEAEWELVTFDELEDVFVRMIRTDGPLAFDGKLRPVRFKPKSRGGDKYPCFYIKTVEERGSKTVCIPIKEWRKHYGEL